MKKFLQFIWELIGPVVRFTIGITIGILAITWVFAGFGFLIIFAPSLFPTPEWVRWSVVVFNIICAVIIICGAIIEAYEKVYKN